MQAAEAVPMQINMDKEDGHNDDSDKDANDTGSGADDSMGAGVLRHDMTDKDVLDAPTGATLFADKLTLPIKIDDLWIILWME